MALKQSNNVTTVLITDLPSCCFANGPQVTAGFRLLRNSTFFAARNGTRTLLAASPKNGVNLVAAFIVGEAA
jgi:hypothetical protein